MTSPITLTITLSAESAARLQALADEQQRPLKDVAESTLETALQEEIDDEEDTPDEEILDRIERGIQDVIAGRVRPARQVIEEILRMRHHDDNS